MSGAPVRAATLGAMILGATLSAAAAGPAAPSDSATAALDLWLRALETRTDRSFPDAAPDVPPAEVDSLLAVWIRTGDSPASSSMSPAGAWDVDFGVAAARYNRVEGANVSPGVSFGPTSWPLRLTGAVGYGWAAKEMTGRAGLEAAVPAGADSLHLGAGWGRDVVSYGAGGVAGNTVLALVAGKDYADYLEEEGWSVDVRFGRRRGQVHMGWRDLAQRSRRNRAGFTIVDREEDFRLNPPVDDGRLRRLAAEITLGDPSRDRWAGSAMAATAGGALGGDFDFRRWDAELFARRPTWLGDEIRARLRGTIVTGDPPYQALRFVGGTRLLRGYDINEIATRRSLVLSVDYALGTNVLGFAPPLRTLRLQLVPFFDTATLFELQERGGPVVRLDDPRWRFGTGLRVQYNILGIPGGAGQIRLDVARRLDRGDDATTYRLGLTVER